VRYWYDQLQLVGIREGIPGRAAAGPQRAATMAWQMRCWRGRGSTRHTGSCIAVLDSVARPQDAELLIGWTILNRGYAA